MCNSTDFLVSFLTKHLEITAVGPVKFDIFLKLYREIAHFSPWIRFVPSPCPLKIRSIDANCVLVDIKSDWPYRHQSIYRTPCCQACVIATAAQRLKHCCNAVAADAVEELFRFLPEAAECSPAADYCRLTNGKTNWREGKLSLRCPSDSVTITKSRRLRVARSADDHPPH